MEELVGETEDTKEHVSDEEIEKAIREILSPFTPEKLAQWSTKQIRTHLKTVVFRGRAGIDKTKVEACLERLSSEFKQPEAAQEPTEPLAEPPEPAPNPKKRKLTKLSDVKETEEKEDEKEDQPEQPNAFTEMMKKTREDAADEHDVPINYATKKRKPKTEQKEKKTKRKKKKKGFLDDEVSADDDSEDEGEEEEETEEDRAFIVDDIGENEENGRRRSSKKGKQMTRKKKDKSEEYYDIESESKLFGKEDSGWYAKVDLERHHNEQESIRRIERQAIRMEMIREEEERRREEQANAIVVDPAKTDTIFLGIVGSYFVPGEKRKALLQFDMEARMQMVRSLLTTTWKLPEEKVVLVTGGMGGGDHVAIRLFLESDKPFKGLHIHLPCEWEEAKKGIRGKDNGKPITDNPGRVFNASHGSLNGRLNATSAFFSLSIAPPPPIPPPQKKPRSMFGQQNLKEMFKHPPPVPNPRHTKTYLPVEELQLAYQKGATIYDNCERNTICAHCQYIITIGMDAEERKPFLQNFRGIPLIL